MFFDKESVAVELFFKTDCKIYTSLFALVRNLSSQNSCQQKSELASQLSARLLLKSEKLRKLPSAAPLLSERRLRNAADSSKQTKKAAPSTARSGFHVVYSPHTSLATSLTCGKMIKMRVEPFGVGSIVHIVKRGARGMNIVRDDSDRWRFVRNLYLLNDVFQPSERHHDRTRTALFDRPTAWPQQKPLTSVLAWTLMPNHFHLLLYERQKGGVSKFMQRFCGSMSKHFNTKYQERGSLFQSSYHSRTIDTDEYLQYVFPYIVVKNVFELYVGGLPRAVKNFDHAWRWAASYPFSSFQTAALKKPSPILDGVRMKSLDLPGKNFKRAAYNMLSAHVDKKKEVASLTLEPW